jgi:hypothetical protein
MFSCFHVMHVAVFSTIRSAMVIKHSKLVKRQTPRLLQKVRFSREPHRSSSLAPPGGGKL